jgi:hypothetical protein
MSRDRAIWTIIAVAISSFSVGILLICALQRSLAHDGSRTWLLALLIPLCLLSVVINACRVVRALPQVAD